MIILLSAYQSVLPQLNKTLLILQIVTAITGIIVGSFAFYRIQQKLLSPLSGLNAWINRVSKGDLSARVDVPVGGELENIIRKINKLGESLKTQCQNMDNQVRIQTERISQKTRSLEILYDAAAGIGHLHDLDELLIRFLHTLKDLVHARAAVVRLMTDEGLMRLIACIGLDENYQDEERLIPSSQCLCGTSISDGLYLQTNLQQCGDNIATQNAFANAKILMVGLPIQYSGTTLGAYNLFVDDTELVNRNDIQHLLTSIGRHLGIAIEKARLENHSRRLSIMEERTLLANELHDSLAQVLASLRFQVSLAEETIGQSRDRTGIRQIRIIREGLDQANNQLRELLAHFRTKMDERGLIPAIESMVDRFKKETGIAAFFQNETEQTELPPALEVQVFHIVQEALANVRKHSKAKNVRVLVRSDDEANYLVLVEDDGQGIQEPEVTARPGEHVGLSIMRERAEKLGGAFNIESEPGEGTRVELTFQAPRT